MTPLSTSKYTPIFTFVKRTERIFKYAFGYYKDFVHLQYLLRNAKLYSNSHTACSV
jgi:hypothetical protein